MRKVEKETGLEVEIKIFLLNIYYKFIDNQNNILNIKVVFYIMKNLGGHFGNYSKEFDKIIWENSNEAITLLKYANEKELVTKTTLLVEIYE